MKVEVPGTLDEILETAFEVNATMVSLEYDSSGALEVMYSSGSVGFGVAVTDRAAKERIVSELLKRRQRGVIRAQRDGKDVVIKVTMRDHFGDWAYDLRFKT
ncbi:MAG TPA: hypothetical protein VFP80_04480 [Thermoanaerobaculia bacterium]|nr:hypothetical protein [Thermoanaerobaculia bacterium]